MHIVTNASLKCGDVLGGELPEYSRWRAHNERVVWELLTLRHERSSANKAVSPDDRAVEHYRLDSYQRSVSNRTAMKHGLMTDCHAITHQ